MENYTIFEQRQQPQLTPLEEEAISAAKEQLEELKVEKKRKIESYEQMKKR